jgi:ADP-ribosylglycohydrolase
MGKIHEEKLKKEREKRRLTKIEDTKRWAKMEEDEKRLTSQTIPETIETIETIPETIEIKTPHMGYKGKIALGVGLSVLALGAIGGTIGGIVGGIASLSKKKNEKQ